MSIRISPSSKRRQATLQHFLRVIEAFRAIRPLIPLQHVYVFLLVASEEGCSVQEYADRAGIAQPVMTRILFALSARGRRGAPGYGLVQSALDSQDSRRRQTFLTAKGQALMHEIERPAGQPVKRRHQRATTAAETSKATARDIVQEQWLHRLIAAGRKLTPDDVKLAVRQIEALASHRELPAKK
jgi:DNA-binding MarR family transcriptional regulator